jgi:uncharacterized protein YlxP (DUF503 family)
MVIGVLQFDLLVHGASSLKDKRRVVNSVKDRLHREHLVSVAEVGGHELLNAARLGLAIVGSEGRHVGQVLDAITLKLRALTDAELGDVHREIIQGRGSDQPDDPPETDPLLAQELLSRGEDAADQPAREVRP